MVRAGKVECSGGGNGQTAAGSVAEGQLAGEGARPTCIAAAINAPARCGEAAGGCAASGVCAHLAGGPANALRLAADRSGYARGDGSADRQRDGGQGTDTQSRAASAVACLAQCGRPPASSGHPASAQLPIGAAVRAQRVPRPLPPSMASLCRAPAPATPLASLSGSGASRWAVRNAAPLARGAAAAAAAMVTRQHLAQVGSKLVWAPDSSCSMDALPSPSPHHLRDRCPLRSLARCSPRPPPRQPLPPPALLRQASPRCSGTSATSGWMTIQAGTRRWRPRRQPRRAQWCPCLCLTLRATPPWCCRPAAPRVRATGRGRRCGQAVGLRTDRAGAAHARMQAIGQATQPHTAARLAPASPPPGCSPVPRAGLP